MLHVFQSLLSCNCTHLEISFTPKYPYFYVNNIFMLLSAIVIFIKIDFFYCIYHNNTKPCENKIKSFQKFYIYVIQSSQDTCSYVQMHNTGN